MTEGIEGHTIKRFDAELMELHQRVLEMGGLAARQVHDSVAALRYQDLAVAREVISRERDVDALEMAIDDMVVKILARRQPVAGDLRLVMAVSKSVTDLERLGDEGEKIARFAVDMYAHDKPQPNDDLLRDLWDMEKLASTQLRQSLEAFDRLSSADADVVIQQGGDMESEFRDTLRRLVTYVMDDSRNVGHLVQIVLIAKSLERVADHARNISQYVVFFEHGEDIRHMGTRKDARVTGT